MKEKKKITFFVLALSVVLMSMSKGNYQEDDEDGKSGHNGSPGEQTCAKSSCHTSFALNSGPGSVSIAVVGMTDWIYVPGQTYTVQVTVAQSGKPLFGLGFEALLASGANAGTLTAGTGTHALSTTVNGNSRKTITHLLDGGLSNNSHTFSFTWVAPASGEQVTFYAAGNAADNNGGKLGDYIYTTSQTLTGTVIPNAPTIAYTGSTVLCNGASLSLSVPTQTGVTFTWYDQNNNAVGTGASFSATATGCYHVVAASASSSVNSVNTICVTASTANAAFSGLTTSFCSDESAVVLTPTNTGGTFTGPGVSGNQFNPSLAGPGNHTITYSYTDQNGCSATSSQTVLVNESLDPSFSGLDISYCANDAAVELIPLNTGGVFTGDGVNGSNFDPSVGEGTYTITYSVGSGSCVHSSSAQVTVLPVANASFTGLSNEYCSNALEVTLNPSTAGGAFYGSGISGYQFSPGTAGYGEHTISYTVTGANGCVSAFDQTVFVNQSVSSDFSGLQDVYCSNAESATLIPIEDGGTFTGQGVTGNAFNPSIGEGIYDVTYSAGLGSCLNSTTHSVEVLPIADPTFSGLSAGYCSAVEAVELTPFTPGGTFSGSGVTGNIFDPSIAGIGGISVTYSVVAANGCLSSSDQTVFVYETANSAFAGLADAYCQDGDLIILIPENPGGVFSGEGVTDGIFDPVAAGAGTHIITYTVDFVGCGSATSDTTIVHDMPSAEIGGLDLSYCLDAADVAMTVANPDAVIIGDGVQNLTFSPASAGVGLHTIICNVTDANGCFNTWQTDVNVIGLPSALVALNGITLTSEQSGASYQWLNCSQGNSEVSGAVNQAFTPQVNGNYAVVVTQNGCDVTSDCTEVIVISVGEIPESLSFEMYPNPASERLTLKTNKPAQIRIYDGTGKKYFESNGSAALHVLDVSLYPTGIYQVEITNEDGVQVRKLLVNGNVK